MAHFAIGLRLAVLLWCVWGCTRVAAQTVTVGAGSATNRAPITFFYGYSQSAMIYTAAELGTTSTGFRITQLGFETSLSSG